MDDDQGAAEQASKIIGELAAEAEQSEVKDDEQSDDTDTGTEDDAGDESDGDEGEEGDDAGDDGEGDEDDEDGDKPKKSSRRERYKRRMERLELENAQLRNRQPAGEPAAADVERRVREIVGEAPKESDFNGDYLAFERAQTAYELDVRQTRREVKKEAESSQRERADAMRRKADDHQDRVEEFRTKTDDFDKVMAAADKLKASPTVEELILDSDKSAHLVYFFAKHPNRLAALNRMTEREAAREVGRIESGLSLPKPKVKTSAPNPPKSPKGGAKPPSQEADLERFLDKTYGKNRSR